MPEPNANCRNCGAPHQPGHAVCHFCNTPLVDDLQTQAVQCPQCRTFNDWGATKCVDCGAWVVVKCVFCGNLSPHQLPACLSCKEPFAGAPERLAARNAEAEQQRTLQVVSTVGSVAVGLLEVAVESGHHHSHHHHSGLLDAVGDAASGDGGSLLGDLASSLTSSDDD
jgi:hypothetical protein